ncbi:WbqC family protein, partial [Amylibacter sp.]|nr:WbqC family protein [Amylibacter sp.]
VNKFLCQKICEFLGIATQFACSSDFNLVDNPSERLAKICEQVGGKSYTSGPAAKSYLDIDRFDEKGISVEWFCYENQQRYNQLNPNFNLNVSILDLILNCGNGSKSMLMSKKIDTVKLWH